MQKDIKIGCILQSYENIDKTYKIFLSNNIEKLETETFIGEAYSFQEACQKLKSYLTETGVYQEPYWRFIMSENATFIDFGCWSKYGVFTPAVSKEEIMGES